MLLRATEEQLRLAALPLKFCLINGVFHFSGQGGNSPLIGEQSGGRVEGLGTHSTCALYKRQTGFVWENDFLIFFQFESRNSELPLTGSLWSHVVPSLLRRPFASCHILGSWTEAVLSALKGYFVVAVVLDSNPGCDSLIACPKWVNLTPMMCTLISFLWNQIFLH